MLKKQTGGGIAVLGSAAESDLCAQVAAGIGSGAVSLAGQTALPELAAILSECALAVSNDSGGMHLAAAVGIPVLAIFGITDPQKTGPLGPRARVLQDSAQRSRDIPRNSDEAAASLRRITPEKALTATQALLAKNNA
jgi:ADP-heptose:LPS heptosyltransferase